MAIVSLPLPAQITNGAVSDATQVMADLNAIANNVNSNAAKNGVNGDITQLTALTNIGTGLTISSPTISTPTITTPSITGGTFSAPAISSPSITGGTVATATITGSTITGGTIDGTLTGVTQAVGTNNTTLSTTAFTTAAVNSLTKGLVLLATVTPTAAVNVDFLNVFSSVYDSYRIIGEGILPSGAANAAVQLSLSFANAGAVDTASHIYVTTSGAASAGQNIINLSPLLGTSGTGSIGGVLVLDLYNTNATIAGIKTGVAQLTGDGAAGTSGTFTSSTTTFAYNGGALSGVRLQIASTGFTATGKIRVYGYTNT